MRNPTAYTPCPGGFGLRTLLPLKDGRMLPSAALQPGMILSSGAEIIGLRRYWAKSALIFNGSIYSPANLIYWVGARKALTEILDLDPDHQWIGPTQLVLLATSDHKVETPIGVMSDLWITQARYDLFQAQVKAKRLGKGGA